MADFPWSEVFNNTTPIPGAAGSIVSAGRAIACGLYSRYPGWLLDIQAATPAGAALRAFWDRMCPEPNYQPPVPDQPFSGGQCCDVLYDVVVDTTDSFDGTIRHTLFGVTGDIRTTTITIETIEGGSGSAATNLVHGGGANCEETNQTFVRSVPVQALPAKADIISVVRSDGQPDVCGDPPPQWPVIVPPPTELNFDLTLNIGGVDITVPVSIPITNFSPNVNIRPEFNLNLGDIQLKFTMEGIDLSFNPTINFPRFPGGNDPRDPSDRPPPVNPPGGGGGSGECPDVDLQPVLNAIANLKTEVDELEENVELLLDCDRCDLEPVDNNGYASRTLGTVNSGIFRLDPKSRWVLISVTTVPVNAKVQSGSAAPDVYYMGWSQFGSGNSMMPRTPIHFLETCRPTPEGANVFALTLPLGYIGTVTELYEGSN